VNLGVASKHQDGEADPVTRRGRPLDSGKKTTEAA